jgi:hypothetical protein
MAYDMPHPVTIVLSDRERAALDEIRTRLSFHSDEQAIMGGLYKLAAWIEPNIDVTLFRLDRETALREHEPVEPDPQQPDLWEDPDD